MTNNTTTTERQYEDLIQLLLKMHRVQGVEGKTTQAIPIGAPIIVSRPCDHTSSPFYPKSIYVDHLHLGYHDLPQGANAYIASEPYKESLFAPMLYAVQPYQLKLEK